MSGPHRPTADIHIPCLTDRASFTGLARFSPLYLPSPPLTSCSQPAVSEHFPAVVARRRITTQHRHLRSAIVAFVAAPLSAPPGNDAHAGCHHSHCPRQRHTCLPAQPHLTPAVLHSTSCGALVTHRRHTVSPSHRLSLPPSPRRLHGDSSAVSRHTRQPHRGWLLRSPTAPPGAVNRVRALTSQRLPAPSPIDPATVR